MTAKPKARKAKFEIGNTHSGVILGVYEIRERISEIWILLGFGPFPAPYSHLSDELGRELAVLQSLLERAAPPSRTSSDLPTKSPTSSRT
jgi:hypothetical protein